MRNCESVWAVVEVWRGFPVEVKLFRHYEAATAHEQLVRARMDDQYDETGIFEISLEPTPQDLTN
jgi:hypothetical protein